MNDISSISREFLAGSSLLHDFEEALITLKVHALHPSTDVSPSAEELQSARRCLREILLDLDASISPESVDQVRARSDDRIPGNVAVHFRSSRPEAVEAMRERLRHVIGRLEDPAVDLGGSDLDVLDSLAVIIDEERARLFSQMTRRG